MLNRDERRAARREERQLELGERLRRKTRARSRKRARALRCAACGEKFDHRRDHPPEKCKAVLRVVPDDLQTKCDELNRVLEQRDDEDR